MQIVKHLSIKFVFLTKLFKELIMNSVKLIFLALALVCQSAMSTAVTPDPEVALPKAEVLLMTGSKLKIKDTSRNGTPYYIQTKANGHTSVWDDTSSAVYGGYLKEDVPGVSQDNTCVEYSNRVNGVMCFRLIRKDDGQIYVKRFNIDRFNGQVSKQREDPLYN